MAPKKSGQIIRLEPEGTKLLEAYPQMAQRFKDVVGLSFSQPSRGTMNIFQWSSHIILMALKL
jgi:hypothetical protein